MYVQWRHRGAEIARPDIARPENAAPLNRSQRGEHPSVQEKSNVLIDKRIKPRLSRFDSGASRLQFVHAVSHSVGAHTESLHPRADNSSNSSNSSEDEDEAGRRRCSDNFRGVGIGNSSRGNNLGQLLLSVHRGATCWLRSSAVRT